MDNNPNGQGYTPQNNGQYGQGYNPQQPQQGYNPQQTQQGYNPQQFGQQANMNRQRQGIPPVKPNNNIVLAFVTIFCCAFGMPFGIVGLVKASMVDSLYNAGQYQSAQIAADEAKKWSFIGIGVGAAFYIIYLVIYFIAGAAVFSQLH